MSDKVIYLGSPYSHPDRQVRIARFNTIARVAAELIRQGHLLFCPITHTHPINELGIPFGWDTWQRYDHAMIDRCQELWIADMPGWQESVGLTSEIQYTMESSKPVYLFNHHNVIEGLPVKLIEQYNPFISQRI